MQRYKVVKIGHVPSHSQFSARNFENWEWPGNEASEMLKKVLVLSAVCMCVMIINCQKSVHKLLHRESSYTLKYMS